MLKYELFESKSTLCLTESDLYPWRKEPNMIVQPNGKISPNKPILKAN